MVQTLWLSTNSPDILTGRLVKLWARGIQHAVRLQEAAVVDLLSGGVLDGELDPRFVEIANFGNERVADVFVLDDDLSFDDSFGAKLNGHGAEGRDELVVASFLHRENIHVQEISGLQELDCFLQLLVEAVIEGHGCVAGRPAMRGENPVLGAVFGQRRLARDSCGNPGRC